MRSQLASLLEGPDLGNTAPDPCSYCDFCDFQETCTDYWRASDSLVYVAGIREGERATLEAAGVGTLTALASSTTDISGLDPTRLGRLRAQAALQLEAGVDGTGALPYRLIPQTDDPVWGRGFEHLPAPDDGDVILDFEGDPFWRADVGLFFLFGFIARDASGTWQFQGIWAHDKVEEATATAGLIELLAARRQEFPGMHVYHYNHTERSALQSLTAEHGVAGATLDTLIETGLFVDLYPVVRNAVQVGTESYGLKPLERLTDYRRGHDIERGSAAVVEYEQFMKDRDPVRLGRIASYNEDDVRSTLVLRDWLVGRRPQELAWRAAYSNRWRDIPTWIRRWPGSMPLDRTHRKTTSGIYSGTGCGSGAPTRRRSWPRGIRTMQRCSLTLRCWPDWNASVSTSGRPRRENRSFRP